MPNLSLDAAPPAAPLPPLDRERPVWRAIGRGVRGLCPNCGVGRLFAGYLKVSDHCAVCGEAYFHQRADDAPPYATMLIVGHVVVPLVLLLEKLYHPELWVHAVVWLPVILGLSLLILPRVKGALVALQWALVMHGFNPHAVPDTDPVTNPTAEPGIEPSVRH